MTDNKLVKTVLDAAGLAATLTGLAAGIGWAAKKVFRDVEKEKKILEQHFDDIFPLIEQVMEDRHKLWKALLNGQAVQYREVLINIIKKSENIISECQKTEYILTI